MTTIACWFNKENSHTSVWVCGDSKITTATKTTLSESSPKIFSVPVHCYAPGPQGFFNSTILNTTVGVAYAGNSIVGLTLSSALSTCLTSVISIAIPPALDDIAEFALKLLQLYVKELGVVACKRAECEVAIIGFCPVEHKLKMYYLTPSINQGELEYKLEKHPDDQGDDFVLLLGADKSRIRKNIEAFRRERLKDISWWRAPKNVISDEVENSDNPTIGGHLQLGICNQLGFQVYSVCRPYSLGGAAYLSYLGLNVSSDFGQIGSCRIGMPGML